jgi:acyl-CoA dehydrogenase
LTAAVDALERATGHLRSRLADGGVNDALAGATPYLRMFGHTAGGWLMAKSALAARRAIERGDADGDRLRAKLVTAHFYCTQLLPQVLGLEAAATAPADDLFAIEAEALVSA